MREGRATGDQMTGFKGVSKAAPPQADIREPAGRPDVIERELEASFPASDAPSWTPVTGIGRPASRRSPHLRGAKERWH